jgi:cohesin loading factor subunit SCC2
MSNIIFPVIEGMAGDSKSPLDPANPEINSRYLSHLVQSETSSRSSKAQKSSPFAHPALSSIAQSASAAFQHLSALISRTDLSFSDSLVIQTVYLATAPLFVTEPSTARRVGAKDKSGKAEGGVMKSLRIEALGCLRGVSPVLGGADLRLSQSIVLNDSGSSKRYSVL